MTTGAFHVELEQAPVAGDDLPYKAVGVFHNVDFDELANLVAKHLGTREHGERGAV